MIQRIDIGNAPTLDQYGSHLHLAQSVSDLQRAARRDVRRLRGRKIWMINSTAEGGGVAEMLPKVVSVMRGLGLDAEWLVVGSQESAFFRLTKRIHNLLHGTGDPRLTPKDYQLYDRVSREAAAGLATYIGPDDLVIVHDPQPLGTGALLKQQLDVPVVWRCHIGLDTSNPCTEAAWEFLRPWASVYDRAVFTFPEYVPAFLTDRADIISPAIDPLSDKNRELSIRKVAGVLSNARLDGFGSPVLPPPFETPAQRLQADGSFAPAHRPDSIGLLYRPIVTQVSRWDRLKGWVPLLDAFEILKRGRLDGRPSDAHRQRLDLVRLVLAGPDPAAIQDDPEGLEVFRELCEKWMALPNDVQKDVVLLVLPMASRAVNALMVNALQRCSSVIVQNSFQEGFGLTVTEGMWKRNPILGSHAVGIRNQVRDGVDGRLVEHPEDTAEVARTLDEMLVDPALRGEMAHNGQRRVAERFLIFTQVRSWLTVLNTLV